MKKIFSCLWGLIFILPLVSADIIVPFTTYTGSLFPIIFIAELILFYLLMNKAFNIKTGFWRAALIVFIANLVTSIIGIFIPVYRNFMTMFWIAFILTLVIEYLVLILFFLKREASKLSLFLVNLAMNVLSYSIVYIIHRY